MIIAQITDMHVMAAGQKAFGRVDVNANLAAILRRLAAHDPRPDLVLVTGDMTFDGDEAEYAALAEIMAGCDIPFHVMPGNHDNRARIRAAFPGHDYLPGGAFLHYAIDAHPLRIVALDTLDAGSVDGRLCEARLDWLAARLAEAPDRPTLIAMHHPPIDIGIGWLASTRFEGRDAARDIIAQHDQVVGVICGHVHRCVQAAWANTVVHTGASTAYQFPLHLNPDAPRGWVAEPPAFSLHYWQAESGLMSHTGYAESFGGVRELG